jgi:hypothetical protein
LWQYRVSGVPSQPDGSKSLVRSRVSGGLSRIASEDLTKEFPRGGSAVYTLLPEAMPRRHSQRARRVFTRQDTGKKMAACGS